MSAAGYRARKIAARAEAGRERRRRALRTVPAGPLCESWTRLLTEPVDADWETCTHDSCWFIATGGVTVTIGAPGTWTCPPAVTAVLFRVLAGRDG
jgi:hypothetical protein